MDSTKGKDLERQLQGRRVGNWIINSYIDCGKSAAVFHGTGDDGDVAVKIFDDELIKRYGDDVQFARISRELTLVGASHPNLVRILGGGVDDNTNNHYIAMEYLPEKNLKKALPDIPVEMLPLFVQQLAEAAMFLESRGLVHRDIKPENIVILENPDRLVLLDLGVMRPISGSSLTDSDGVQPFVGTLQYSSPEFLLRKEEDSIDGWRALTYYQIGGVIHDLVMRRPLFGEFETPFARLVNAVQHDVPQIRNPQVPQYLVDLANCCLVKNWQRRIQLVNWASFKQPQTGLSPVQSAKERVLKRAAVSSFPYQPIMDETAATNKLLDEVVETLQLAARAIRVANSELPPIRILPNEPDRSGFSFEFGKAIAAGFPHEIRICLKVSILDLSAKLVEIHSGGCIGSMTGLGPSEYLYSSIFKGSFDAGRCYDVLEAQVYETIDQLQQAEHGVDGRAWLVPTKEL